MDASTIQAYAEKIEDIVTGGVGAGATATTTLAATGSIRSATVNAGGSGYSVGNVLTVSGGTGGTFVVTSVGASGAVTGVSKTAGGTGYSNSNAAATTVSPAGGTGCTLKTTVEFATGTITVDAGGADYDTAIAKFSGGGNANWSYGSTTVVAGEVTVVTAPVGVKFTSVPTITIQPGGPADASAFLTALRAFDVTQQDARLKQVLLAIRQTEILTPESAPVVVDAIAAL